ncbi:MAG: hypothetical protein WKH64_16065, partial [Chloroflexia bacterium]
MGSEPTSLFNQGEMGAVEEGTFEIACTTIELVQGGEQPQNFSGAIGRVCQDESGRLPLRSAWSRMSTKSAVTNAGRRHPRSAIGCPPRTPLV